MFNPDQILADMRMLHTRIDIVTAGATEQDTVQPAADLFDKIDDLCVALAKRFAELDDGITRNGSLPAAWSRWTGA